MTPMDTSMEDIFNKSQIDSQFVDKFTQFWMKYEAKKKEIKKFKAQSDQFYLTSNTLKREPTH